MYWHHNSFSLNCPIGTTSYIIKYGDTLWALARQFETTVEAILASNPGINPNNLIIGQRICIPTTTVPQVCPPNSIPYTIQSGDSFWLIAQRLGVAVDDILLLNPGVDPRFLRVGQQICIPAPPAPPPILRFFCTIPLLPVEADGRAGGSLWIREDEFTVTGYSTLFAATFLPEPETLGNFDAYIGRVTIAQPAPDPPIIHSIVLTRIDRPLHQVTWAGTRIMPEGPAVTDVAEIRPYNTGTDVVGPAVLRNNLQACGN